MMDVAEHLQSSFSCGLAYLVRLQVSFYPQLSTRFRQTIFHY